MSKFIMMIGIAGSGKSTFAEKIAQREDAVVLSSDKLREELFENVWEFRRNAELFGEMYRRAYKYLCEGRNVILDATNIYRRQRKYILKKFKAFFKECYFIKTPLSRVLYQNRQRDRNVPEYIIRRMYARIQEPEFSEGWDRITVVFS